MRREKIWCHPVSYVAIFLWTILCSTLVWGAKDISRDHNRPSILEGIPDQHLITGKLFVYKIPDNAFKNCNNCSIKISAATEDQKLPQWLTYEESTRKLIAVPTTHDGQSLYIKVTLSDNENKYEDVSDIFYLEVKPFYMSSEYSNSNKPEKNCYKGISLIQTTLIFAVNLYKLDVLARYDIMVKLADFLDLNATDIRISTSKEMFSKHDASKSYTILASGRGNTDVVLPNVTELTWRVPCSVYKEVHLYMQVLEHNVIGGRLTNELGFDVVGWYISGLVNPSKQFRPRLKRQAPRLSTPTPTPQIHVIPATKARKSSSSMIKTDDRMTNRITPIEESHSAFVSSRESAVNFEPTKTFTVPTPSASRYERFRSESYEPSGGQLHPTSSSSYSQYEPTETRHPDQPATTPLPWGESSKYTTSVYEISGSGEVSRFSEFPTEEPITPPTDFGGEDFTKPPVTPFIDATPTLTTDNVAEEDGDFINTDLDYNGSGSGSGSGDEDIDEETIEEEDGSTPVKLKPSEGSIPEETTPTMKTLYIDQTDTNTFYFEESEITIRNIPQPTTYEPTATPTTPSLSTAYTASWPSREVPIDPLISVGKPYASTRSPYDSVTHTGPMSPEESSSIRVRPSRIMSGHSDIDSQIGSYTSIPPQPSGTSISSGHSHIDPEIGGRYSVPPQPSGSSSGHSYVDSEIGSRSTPGYVKPSRSGSSHSYIDMKPSHSSGQSYDNIKPSQSSDHWDIEHRPSRRINETSARKPSDVNNYSSIYKQPFPAIDSSSSVFRPPSHRVDQSSVHLKVPESSSIHPYISEPHHRVDESSRGPSSAYFQVESSRSKPYHKPSARYEYSSIFLKPSHTDDQSLKHLKTYDNRGGSSIKSSQSVDQSYHIPDPHVSIIPSQSRIYPSSSQVRPVELTSRVDPNRSLHPFSNRVRESQSHRRVDRSSERISPSSSHRRVSRSSGEIRPSYSRESFHPQPSDTYSYTDIRRSSHSSDYSTIMPSSSDIRGPPSRVMDLFSLSREILPPESRLPLMSSSEMYLASVLVNLVSEAKDMFSSSSHILMPPSLSKESYRPSSSLSSLLHHLSKTKDTDSSFETTRLYSTPDRRTTQGSRRSKDHKHTSSIPKSVTKTSSRFPPKHTKTVDPFFTTQSTVPKKRVTDKDRSVTKQVPTWRSVRFTPEITTVKSRKTQKKKQRKPKPPNMAPDVINPIGKIYAFAGKMFEFQIPENTFNDLEDGSTRDLTLDVAFKWDSYRPPTYSYSWVQFDDGKQTFSGLPLPQDMKESPIELTINAIDQGGKIAQDIIQIYINASDTDTVPTQEFIMRFDVNGRRFLNDRRKFKNLIKKLSSYFDDRDANSITVIDARPGSLIVTWTNNSIATDHCDNETIHEMKQKVVDHKGYINPKFSKYMSPKYKVTNVEFQMKGACQDVSEASGTGGVVQVDPWAEAIIPTVIAVAIAIFIVVIILLICSRKQKKEKSKPKEPRHSFEDQDPVMFHREQAQKDKSNRSKRAVILPGDGKPKSSARRKFSPQIGLPYQPSTLDEQESPSDEEIYGNENASYSNTYTQPPPPYRLPPPYHVDNGSSYV